MKILYLPRVLARIWLFLLCIMATPLMAEQKQVFGDYEVHYSVVPTRFIPQETASAYNITRGKNRMLLNISVRLVTPNDASTETIEQEAVITGQRHDLMRPFALSFREVRERGAIYYLSDFLIINEELSRFEIDIALPSGEQFAVEFVKKMYIDE